MSAYSDKVIADGALAYWPLDDPSGTVARDAAGSRAGTIHGAVTSVDGVGGAKAMEFAGGWITAPDLPDPTSFSVEMWAWNDPAMAESYDDHIAFARTYTTLRRGPRSISVNINSDVGQPVPMYAQLEYGDCRVSTYDNNSYIPPGWHHLVFTYTTSGDDENQIGLFHWYQDGVLLFAPDMSGYALQSDNDPYPMFVAIGTYPQSTPEDYLFLGRLQDVAYYPRALTAQEVADHFALREDTPTGPPNGRTDPRKVGRLVTIRTATGRLRPAVIRAVGAGTSVTAEVQTHDDAPEIYTVSQWSRATPATPGWIRS